MEGSELLPVAALSAPSSIVAAQSPSSSISSRLAGLVRSMTGVGKDEKKDEAMCRRLQSVRVKFIRLVHRLGQSPDSGIAAQVLYRFALAEQLKGGNQAGNTDKASAVAMEEESSGRGELDFCCTVLLLGKSGVGKSATINAILDKPMTESSAFHGTEKVRVVTGSVKGIQMKFIDTPGLSPCAGDRRRNEWVVSSVKRCLKRTPPDIVLYVDRLDSRSKDVQLMRFISDRFGLAIWFNAIIVLTHGASTPPEAFGGLPMAYDTYVSQRTRVVQNAVRAAVGDERIMNPVSLVENHSTCRLNKAGERVLPNGMVWRPELLLLCFSARILAEANLILKLPESMPLKSLGTRRSGSPMPVLLASLLQSRSEVQQPQEEEFGRDSEDFDESDDDTEYDQLPPFRRLNEDELAELDKRNRASYFEELALRERLYRKKLWKMQCKRLKHIKMDGTQDEEEEIERRRGMSPGLSAETPVPTSFDSDDPTHRYRYIDDATWLVRPVADGRGWDHENAFDAAHMEKSFCIGKKVPVSVAGQIRKDKKETSIIFDGSAAYRHSEDKVTTGGLDIQTVGKDICYSLWTGTCFKNLKQNKTMAGMGATMVGDQAVVGIRLEDKLVIGKRFKIVSSIATSLTKGDAAYGGIMEATVVGPDYPADRSVCTVGLSVMNWTQKDVALGANLQSQFNVLDTNMVVRGNVNNRGTGQITVKANSSEYVQIGLLGLLPLLRVLCRNRLFRLDFW